MKNLRYTVTILLLIALSFTALAQEPESTKPVKTSVIESGEELMSVKKKVNDSEKKANKERKKAKKAEKAAKKKEKEEKLKKDIESKEKDIKKFIN